MLGEALLGGGPFGGRRRALQGESAGLRDRVGSVETGGESLGQVADARTLGDRQLVQCNR